MLKKLLLTAVIGAIGFGASAATNTLDFTYVNKVPVLYGLGDEGPSYLTFQAAILLNRPDLTGMKVKKIDAYINEDASTIPTIKNCWLFASSSIGGSDLLLQNVTPTPATLWGVNYSPGNPSLDNAANQELAVLSYTLPQPLELTGAPIYFGYSVELASKNNINGKPILQDISSINPNACFVKLAGASENRWTNDAYLGGAITMYLTLEYEGTDYYVSIANISKAYGAENKEFTVPVTVTNLGKATMNNLSYQYTVGENGTPQTGYYEFDKGVASSVMDGINLNIPLEPIAEVGTYDINFQITEVNGYPNSSYAASATFPAEILPFLPKKRTLVEEYTNLFCGFCPRGFVAMEYLAEEFADETVLIAYHNNEQGKDPMCVDQGMVWGYGNPSAAINRDGLVYDPYYGDMIDQNTGNQDFTKPFENLGIKNVIISQNALYAPAEIEVSNITVDPETWAITATATTNFAQAVADDSYRIGFVVTCNDMYDPQWQQTNYFSKTYYGGQYANEVKNAPYLSQCTEWPTYVALHFNDVAINLQARQGIVNSVKDVTPGVPFDTEFEFNISAVYNAQRQDIRKYIDVNNLVINTFVIDRQNGKVVNAAKRNLTKDIFDAVESVEADLDVVSTTYFDLTGVRVANPTPGIFIKSEKLSDGTVRTSKVVVR
ncbi:MAG: hypothetical protein J1F07_03730 [Muribaculaceae bacterium]|nr:hypothetical protein [Muribaculaceae bacterium]